VRIAFRPCQFRESSHHHAVTATVPSVVSLESGPVQTRRTADPTLRRRRRRRGASTGGRRPAEPASNHVASETGPVKAVSSEEIGYLSHCAPKPTPGLHHLFKGTVLKKKSPENIRDRATRRAALELNGTGNSPCPCHLFVVTKHLYFLPDVLASLD
jgi:hypothetical protein